MKVNLQATESVVRYFGQQVIAGVECQVKPKARNGNAYSTFIPGPCIHNNYIISPPLHQIVSAFVGNKEVFCFHLNLSFVGQGPGWDRVGTAGAPRKPGPEPGPRARLGAEWGPPGHRGSRRPTRGGCRDGGRLRGRRGRQREAAGGRSHE